MKNNWLKRQIPKIKKYRLSIASISVFFVLWEFVSRLSLINPLFISSPSKISQVGYDLVKSGEIFPHLFISLEALIVGFALAVIAGVGAGLAIGSSKKLYEIFLPYVFALNSMPMVAVVPLVIIWFGIGLWAKIAVVFLMVLKPILINTIDGVRDADENLIKMARSFGAGCLFTLRTVTFFNTLPFIFSGLRIAVGKGIIGLIIAEAFGYGKGLGFLVAFYGNTFQTPRLMFTILVLMTVSLAIISLISIIENKIIKWKEYSYAKK